jgi:hypothetical protein
MIIGNCVNCNEVHFWDTDSPGVKYGSFAHVKCDKCYTTYWLYVTHGYPYAITEEEFSKCMEYTSNSPSKEIGVIGNTIIDIVSRSMASEIIGVPPLQGPVEQIKTLREIYGHK